MRKTQYLKELSINAAQSRGAATNKKPDIIKIQSWLNLYAVANPSAGTATGIDGDFGKATEQAVKNFQTAIKIPVTGKVDNATFAKLCEPLNKAFTTKATGKNLRELIVNVAKLHLSQKPFELTINNQANSGPWVRSYMDAFEGEQWYWCMGFVQTMIDQAASQLNKDIKTLMPLTYSCDVVATTGIQKGLLIRSTALRANPALVKPGDLFLVQKSPSDWMHTGIVTQVIGDAFETIEGNTNTDGSHNGNGVYKRMRNFKTAKLDVFSIEPLVG
jgi:hypothetical protein